MPSNCINKMSTAHTEHLLTGMFLRPILWIQFFKSFLFFKGRTWYDRCRSLFDLLDHPGTTQTRTMTCTICNFAIECWPVCSIILIFNNTFRNCAIEVLAINELERGVFAKKKIKANTFLCCYDGEVMSERELKRNVRQI
jgi:SET domain-containing protein